MYECMTFWENIFFCILSWKNFIHEQAEIILGIFFINCVSVAEQAWLDISFQYCSVFSEAVLYSAEDSSSIQ